MFTVKHVSEAGNETLYECDGEVMFTPYDDNQAVPPSDAHVYVPSLRGAINELTPLYGGMVYVMNRFGSTVAKYDLRSPKMTAAAADASNKAGTPFGVIGVGRKAA